MLGWYQNKVVPKLLNSEMGGEELKKIRREVLQDARGVVLELGVGPGYNIPLYNNISKLYALEPSGELVEIAKTRVGGVSFPVEFLSVGAESIPLPDHSIDTVVSTWTLCSVSDPQKVLQEIRRVLKPQGKFVFADHGASPRMGVRLAQKLFTAVSKYFTGNCHYDRDIERLIKEAGFKIEGIEYFPEDHKPLIYNYQGAATP